MENKFLQNPQKVFVLLLLLLSLCCCLARDDWAQEDSSSSNNEDIFSILMRNLTVRKRCGIRPVSHRQEEPHQMGKETTTDTWRNSNETEGAKGNKSPTVAIKTMSTNRRHDKVSTTISPHLVRPQTGGDELMLLPEKNESDRAISQHMNAQTGAGREELQSERRENEKEIEQRTDSQTEAGGQEQQSEKSEGDQAANQSKDSQTGSEGQELHSEKSEGSQTTSQPKYAQTLSGQEYQSEKSEKDQDANQPKDSQTGAEEQELQSEKNESVQTTSQPMDSETKVERQKVQSDKGESDQTTINPEDSRTTAYEQELQSEKGVRYKPTDSQTEAEGQRQQSEEIEGDQAVNPSKDSQTGAEGKELQSEKSEGGQTTSQPKDAQTKSGQEYRSEKSESDQAVNQPKDSQTGAEQQELQSEKSESGQNNSQLMDSQTEVEGQELQSDEGENDQTTIEPEDSRTRAHEQELSSEKGEIYKAISQPSYLQTEADGQELPSSYDDMIVGSKTLLSLGDEAREISDNRLPNQLTTTQSETQSNANRTETHLPENSPFDDMIVGIEYHMSARGETHEKFGSHLSDQSTITPNETESNANRIEKDFPQNSPFDDMIVGIEYHMSARGETHEIFGNYFPDQLTTTPSETQLNANIRTETNLPEISPFDDMTVENETLLPVKDETHKVSDISMSNLLTTTPSETKSNANRMEANLPENFPQDEILSRGESFTPKHKTEEISNDLKSDRDGMISKRSLGMFRVQNVRESLVQRGQDRGRTTQGVKVSDKQSDSPEDLEHSRLIGGKLEYIEWPWVVSVYRAQDMAFLCAGTLIDEWHILSAAHCYTRYRDLPLVASVGRLLKIARKEEGVPVEQIFLHEGFEPSCYCNDIAVLRLRTKTRAMPACLPMPGSTLPMGANTTLLGWGDRRYVSGPGTTGSVRLQRVEWFPIQDSHWCRDTLSRVMNMNLPSEFEDYYLCAGLPDGSKDACQGDSGGPLLYQDPDDGLWTVVGVVSFGFECGVPGVPATYTKVSYYLPWIHSRIDARQ